MCSSSPSSSPPYTRESESSLTCSCLEEHSALLCRLKALTQSRGMPSIGAVLTETQQALAPWQNLIQCRLCPHEDDLSVLLLGVMSIRSILRCLQTLCFGNTSPSSGYATPIDQIPSANKVTPNGYEPTQNEHKHITDVLILHAMEKIRFALLSLKEKFIRASSPKAASDASDARLIESGHMVSLADSDMHVRCIQKLIENLESTIQTVACTVKAHSAIVNTCGGETAGNI